MIGWIESASAVNVPIGGTAVDDLVVYRFRV